MIFHYQFFNKFFLILLKIVSHSVTFRHITLFVKKNRIPLCDVI